MTCDERFMRQAIETARAGIAAGQSPFGTAIVRGDTLLALAHNQVWSTGDPTAHAEVTAIRLATKQLGAITLDACVLYSTCEPCPMCMAAIHWARLDRVIYGAAIADAASAGFHELHLSAATLVDVGGSPVRLQPGCLADECRALFPEWLASGQARAY